MILVMANRVSLRILTRLGHRRLQVTVASLEVCTYLPPSRRQT